MSLFMSSTQISPEATIGEIQKILSKHGVTAMMTEYEGPQVSSVSFTLLLEGKKMSFRMPCNWRAIEQIFKTDDRSRVNVRLKKNETIADQAIRTAWRIILRWVEAQMALVEVNMTTVPQIFLPYTIMHDGRTLAETVSENPTFLLDNN